VKMSTSGSISRGGSYSSLPRMSSESRLKLTKSDSNESKSIREEGGQKILNQRISNSLNFKSSADGTTPLAAAARDGQDTVVEMFILQHIEMVNVQNHRGYTPLIFAASLGNIKVVSSLIEKGQADVNLVDYKGRSALMHASKLGDVVCVERLLRAGADPLLLDSEGKMALQMTEDPLITKAIQTAMQIRQEQSQNENLKDKSSQDMRDSCEVRACKIEDGCLIS